MFSLTDKPIDREAIIDVIKDDQAGALVVFEGWVRDHNQGKKVSSLEYQVYPELALKEGMKILHEAKHKFNLHKIECSHRFGHLKLGEIAVWIGATATHRDDAFKATRFVIDEIKHRLPIWKKEHYIAETPNWVFCRDHHTHVHFHEADYYKKQNKLIEQDKLKNAHVLVIGAGGLGCPVLTSLAMAGVGHLDVVEFDKIDISNIHRQPLYSPAVVGEKKVTVAQNKLSELNPFIHVHGHDARIDSENAERFIQGKDLIVDCTDNMQTKFLLHDTCFKLGIPLISASIYQFEGQIRTFDPKNQSGCLRCTVDKTPEDSLLGNCNDFGVVGAAVNALGSLQACEVISFLQTGSNQSLKETFYFNFKNFSQMKIKNFKKDDCPCCRGEFQIEGDTAEVNYAELDLSAVQLVDIRGLEDNHLNQYISSPKKIIVYCHKGIRSKGLVSKYRARGYHQFYSLKGGEALITN